MHKFDTFDIERKNKLINQGFIEFGTHGYKRASLNRILEKSEIPKGVFYHYFNNKKALYQYLIYFGIETITLNLMDSAVLKEKDYIKRLLKSYEIKVDAYHTYSFFEKFLMKVYSENNSEFLETINLEDSKVYGKRFISENIDFTLFKTCDNDANIRVASRYLQQTFNDIIHNIQSMTKTEIMTYLTSEANYLRSVLYKEDTND